MKKKLYAAIFLSVSLLHVNCAGNVHITENVPDAASLNYPLVLVHGIVAHDRGRFITFWGRIPQTLERHGVKVFFGNTDSFGDFDSNAQMLKNTIDRVLLETGSEKVNIIAHSKGGLDSRYMIWIYDYGDRVASLTTIATPHHGSEIADLLHGRRFVHRRNTGKILDILGRLHGDENPAVYDVHLLLTTDKMREFNEHIGMDARVFYQSLYTTLESPFDDTMFVSSYRFLKRVRGKNDGFVSEYSAQWGDNIRKIEGRISHAEIVDFKRRTISGIYIPDIYTHIIDELIALGF